MVDKLIVFKTPLFYNCLQLTELKSVGRGWEENVQIVKYRVDDALTLKKSAKNFVFFVCF